MANRAQQDIGIHAQLVERVGRQNLAGPQITIAAVIEILQFKLDALGGANRLEHFHALGRHLRSRAVAADHRHAQYLVAHLLRVCCLKGKNQLLLNPTALAVLRPSGLRKNFRRHSGQRSHRSCC